jgi:DNA-3-methyladenine glycosylase
MRQCLIHHIYFTYGMHWCLNIVTGAQGVGEAVLIRALVPDKNKSLIRSRRVRVKREIELMNGPGKVCQGLGVTGTDNRKHLGGDRFILLPPPDNQSFEIHATHRIGISRNADKPWRFVGRIL